MEYRKLGSSGLKVSQVGLGCNNFGWWADEATSISVVHRALELGVNFFDTADWYDRGRSEEFLGKALLGRRQKVLIATKFGAAMGDGPNERGGSRHYIMRAVEASLRRLQTDYIDLYQMHVPDPDTPIEETLRALDDLIRSGKVRYIGCSNFAAWQLSEALWTSRHYGLHSFITVQVQYSLLVRSIEKELVPCCQANNIGIIPWGPLHGGFLTGKYRKGQPPPDGSRLSKSMPLYDRNIVEDTYDLVTRLDKFASERGHSVAELAIAWLLAKPWVSTVIPGARNIEQVSANVMAGSWKLTPEEIAEVDAISMGHNKG
ncbi:MAG: aldo/keto reductase [Dehalococcoidia bacterium]|nr:aldo/keto reductase [Dehalococcoidia bacterium]